MADRLILSAAASELDGLGYRTRMESPTYSAPGGRARWRMFTSTRRLGSSSWCVPTSSIFGVTRLRRNQLLLARLKGEPCTDCGDTFRPEAMDFDHVRGVKVGNVSDMVGGSTDALVAEIAKCELVCAVCHRIRTRDRDLDARIDLALSYDVLLDD